MIRSLAVVSVLLMLIGLCFIVVSFFESTVESAWTTHGLGEEWRVRGLLVGMSSWLAAAAWHWLAWNRVMKTGGIEAFEWGNRGAWDALEPNFEGPGASDGSR